MFSSPHGEGLGGNATLTPWQCSIFPPPCGWVLLNQPLIPLHRQLGTFRSHDGDYFIEPLLSMDEQEDEDEQNKPHIVYRHSTLHREPSTGRRACDTPGISFLLWQSPPPRWDGSVTILQTRTSSTSCKLLPFTLSFTQSSSEVGISCGTDVEATERFSNLSQVAQLQTNKASIWARLTPGSRWAKLRLVEFANC